MCHVGVSHILQASLERRLNEDGLVFGGLMGVGLFGLNFLGEISTDSGDLRDIKSYVTEPMWLSKRIGILLQRFIDIVLAILIFFRSKIDVAERYISSSA